MMRGLLTELNELLSSEYQPDINRISNNKISYVRVPRTQSDHSFLNSKEWVETAIEIARSKHVVRGGIHKKIARWNNSEESSTCFFSKLVFGDLNKSYVGVQTLSPSSPILSIPFSSEIDPLGI